MSDSNPHNSSQPNVDTHEIAKFNALADSWWDLNAEFKPLHDINPLRLNWIVEKANGIADKHILDVGCGGGILSESMARRGAVVMGIDLGEAPLEAARIHAKRNDVKRIEYRQITVEELANILPNTFDVVTCMEMLEHVPDPRSIVEACKRLVKPGGHVFFSTINRTPKSYAFAIIGAEYVLRMVPRGTHNYQKFIRPSELATAIRDAGLVLEDSTGLHYNPITKFYWLDSRNVDVNYMMCTRRPL